MEGTGDFGVKVNTMPKYVASRTLTGATWNATIMEGDVAEAVSKPKAEDGGDLLFGGSGQLIDYFTTHDLMEEYRLMVVPIVLGSGTKRLFNGVPRRSLTLVDTLTFPTGVVVLTYHPARQGVRLHVARDVRDGYEQDPVTAGRRRLSANRTRQALSGASMGPSVCIRSGVVIGTSSVILPLVSP